MLICRVVRAVVSTVKVEGLNGVALLLVREESEDGSSSGRTLVAADLVGAGAGQTVLVVTGGAVQKALRSREAPADAAVVAILDPYPSTCRSG